MPTFAPFVKISADFRRNLQNFTHFGNFSSEFSQNFSGISQNAKELHEIPHFSKNSEILQNSGAKGCQIVKILAPRQGGRRCCTCHEGFCALRLAAGSCRRGLRVRGRTGRESGPGRTERYERHGERRRLVPTQEGSNSELDQMFI